MTLRRAPRVLRATCRLDASIELILNGDIFDLLKVKIADEWPTEVTKKSRLPSCSSA